MRIVAKRANFYRVLPCFTRLRFRSVTQYSEVAYVPGVFDTHPT